MLCRMKPKVKPIVRTKLKASSKKVRNFSRANKRGTKR